MQQKELKVFLIGTRVKHNYTNGYGVGTIVGYNPHVDSLNYHIKWDSAKVSGAFAYTYNDKLKEFVPVNTKKTNRRKSNV